MNAAAAMALVETLNAMDGIDASAQLSRVGIDVDSAVLVAMKAAEHAVDMADDDAMIVGISMFLFGLVGGARMAQAGLAVADETI